MKKLLFLGLLFSVLMFNACKDDDEMTTGPEYHITFVEPDNSATLAVGDVLYVHIEFDEHGGGTVHHINVKAHHKTSGVELFNTPVEAHVHGASPYAFQYEKLLFGTAPGTYVIEAKVWGLNDGEGEVTASREFTVN